MREQAGSVSLEHVTIVTEPIIAYRSWKVDEDGFLYSLSAHVRWRRDCPAEHPHYRGTHAGGAPPASGCVCGYYAWKSNPVREDRPPLDLPSWMLLDPYATGKVLLWGRVIEHELGYRAQYARPLDIVISTYYRDLAPLAERVAHRYGCLVRSQSLTYMQSTRLPARPPEPSTDLTRDDVLFGISMLAMLVGLCFGAVWTILQFVS